MKTRLTTVLLGLVALAAAVAPLASVGVGHP